MFVDRLTHEQRQALFDLAVMTAAVDNEVSEEELQYLKDYSEAYSIPFDLDKSGLAVVDLLGVMDSKLAKVVTLQELIKISYKDGHFGPEEQDKVFSIAQKMGLNDPALILSIERWVRQGLSCASCHVYNASRKARSDILSPLLGHNSHFPSWRLKSASLVTLQGRYTGCQKNMRATPSPAHGEDYNNLELFTAYMSNGLEINGPSVRQ